MRREEKILLIGSSLWYFGEGMLGPLFAIFTERIGGDILDISWAWATYLIFTGVFIFIVGNFSDKGIETKKKLLVAGFGLNALFTFSYLLVSAPMHLFMVQAGLGIATALAEPTWDALFAEFEDHKHAGMQWGLASGSAYFLTGLGIIIGGFVVTYLSFTVLFVTMGTVQIIATLYQAKILKGSRHAKASP